MPATTTKTEDSGIIESVEVSLNKWNTVRVRKGKFFIDFHLSYTRDVIKQLEMLLNGLNDLTSLPERKELYKTTGEAIPNIFDELPF